MSVDDQRWMRRALELAGRGRGTTSPNPMVGAVLVDGDEVVGEGWHQRCGGPHAEVLALEDAGTRARGATMYVTLEPCCHTGRTGPCTEAVLAAGVSRVVAAMQDPNPRVAGQGLDWLRAAGLSVACGVLEAEARELNRAFCHWITTGRPWVMVKLAVSMDGRVAARGGASRWITGPAARRRVHGLRASMDGIMVGSGTALADDPRLTARDTEEAGGDPMRILVDSSLRVPPTAKLFEGSPQTTAVVATLEGADQPRHRALVEQGVRVLTLSAADGGVDLGELLRALGKLEPKPVTSLLVEGGSVLATSFAAAGLIDELRLHMAPILLGGDGVPAFGPLGLTEPAQAPRFELVGTEHLGEDVELIARPIREDV